MSAIETLTPHTLGIPAGTPAVRRSGDRPATTTRDTTGTDGPTAPTATATPSIAAEPLLPVVGGDLRVPLLDGSSVRFANLDVAATAPALASVAERVARVLPFSGSVHRGAGLPSQVSSTLYEAARRRIGQALGARPDDLVVFTRNTTDATNLLAACVPFAAGDVLTLDLEHHANLLPWHRAGSGHRCVQHADTVDATFDRLEAELRRRPVALLALTGASNVTGELLPIERAVALAHAHGARVFVDAAQLAPHRAIDLTALGADYLALSGHKLYAPYGAGVLVGRRDWLDAAEPYLAGGGAVVEVGAASVQWASGPARHEAGTPNLVGAVAIAAAFEALETLDAEHREAHEEALRRRVVDGLATIDGVDALTVWDADAIGVVAFTVDGYAPGHVGAYLSAEHGIGVRDGRFCAHPLLARFGRPEGALRASFGVGSRLEDADRLVEALRRLVDEGPRHAYCEGPAGWVPEHDTRDLEAWTGLDLGFSDGAAAKASPCGG